MAKRICTVPRCGRPHYGLGFCSMHHWRVKNHDGDPGGPERTRTYGELRRFFLENYLLPAAHDPGWPFSLDVGGYGVLMLVEDPTLRTAHTWACTLTHGPRPSAIHHAAHSCRNRACFWTKHLSWKTPVEHALDKIRDDTLAWGERNGEAKLTADDVRAIRTHYAGGDISMARLGELYGIGASQVHRIVHRKSWKQLD